MATKRAQHIADLPYQRLQKPPGDGDRLVHEGKDHVELALLDLPSPQVKRLEGVRYPALEILR